MHLTLFEESIVEAKFNRSQQAKYPWEDQRFQADKKTDEEENG